MSTSSLRYLGIIIFAASNLATQYLRASDETVSGNLTVTGTIDGAGDTLSLGTRTDTASYPGWAVLYTDGTVSSMEFDATRSTNVWKWQQNASATLQLQMTLDNYNNIKLYDQSSPPNSTIVLNPLGTSTFNNSLVIRGTDTEMPNQTLVNPSSVLTEGLADSRYLVLSETTMLIGSDNVSFSNATASADYSFASGNEADASAIDSTALGFGAAAGGFSAFAAGSGTIANGQEAFAAGSGSVASGNQSTAMGFNTTASNFFALAAGADTNASGYVATAMGSYTTASGTYATVFGYTTTAASYDSFVIGRGNVGGGNATTWVATDPLFEVGNGVSRTPTDALVVYKNGNTAVQGSLSAASLSTTGSIASGSITSSGVITAQPGGDIPMYTGN